MRKAYTSPEETSPIQEIPSRQEIQMRLGRTCLPLAGFRIPSGFLGELLFRASLTPASPPLFGSDSLGTGNHPHGSFLFRSSIIGRLLSGLFPLDLLAHLVRSANRLDVGGLEDLALSKGSDHVLIQGSRRGGVCSFTKPSATASPSGW